MAAIDRLFEVEGEEPPTPAPVKVTELMMLDALGRRYTQDAGNTGGWSSRMRRSPGPRNCPRGGG